ncbi:MAG TPA: hypothetical protein VH500_05920 [Nitrososphaeraceae archaeon]
MKRKSSKDLYVRTLIFAIAIIILGSVFTPYYRILQETFADSDDSNGGDDESANTEDANSKESSQNDDTDDSSSNELAGDQSDSPDLADSNENSGPSESFSLGSPDSGSSFLSESTGRLDHASSHDNNDDHKFRHNAQDIAAELSNLTPQEISKYPISDLSNKDIIMVMGFLEPGDLTRVLLHIPQADLASIEHRISPHTFNEFINRLSELDKNQVEARLLSTTSIG